MNIAERLRALRSLMEAKGYDAYLIPTDDHHQSEYVGEHFKARAYMTGFTGSAGTALITMGEAGLWTDGRYFIQAEKQLANTGIKLFKAGEANVPSLEDYLADVLPRGGVLGFDGRVVSTKRGHRLEAAIAAKNGRICASEDLVDRIWKDRPPFSEKPAFALDEKYTGERTASKLSRIRKAMKDTGATVHIIASLDDICWITNLRGRDIEYFPLLLAYCVITMDGMKLYIDDRKLTAEMKEKLARDNISLHPYSGIYEDVTRLKDNDTILLDSSRLNYALYQHLPKSARIVDRENPTVLMKAIKNETELKNIIRAHIKDGVAVTRFMYWLKQNIGKIEITELSAAEKIEEFRREQTGYLWPSFEPICGYGEHGAIVHYSSTSETDVPIQEGSLFLTDTGGGYYEGSTDITRTFACGQIPAHMKEDFTTVLQGNLHLARAVFLYGTTGYQLDVLARLPAWKRGITFHHGAGHGVGYLMNIHEAPARFSSAAPEKEAHPLQPGMVITNEPGIYVEGSHGVRIENEMIVRKGQRNEYGQFLWFEPVTYVPVDLDAIEPGLLTTEDKEQLNAYHAKVYEVISPYLNEEEKEWLKIYTRNI